MKECIEDVFSISLLIAEHSDMGCQLMKAALQSYPRISVAASLSNPPKFWKSLKAPGPTSALSAAR